MGDVDDRLEWFRAAATRPRGLGAQYILLVRVGNDGLVMVDCDMSNRDDAPPSLVPMARAMVAKL
jgi:hypothetical protein